jgi:hypothetical protein
VTKKPVLAAWVSFADRSKPHGQMFVGCIIVKIPKDTPFTDFARTAVARVRELELWPRFPGSCHNLSVVAYPTNLNEYVEKDIERMLTEKEVEVLGDRTTI